nr:hypothetical protein [Prevotella pallens]
MIRLVKQIKQNLFDGYDNDCLDKTFVVGGKEIRLLDIYNNPLWKLKDRISINDFNTVVASENLKSDNIVIDSYKTSKGLSTYYLFNNTLLYIFSFVEWQPTRFILNIESIWEIE